MPMAALLSLLAILTLPAAVGAAPQSAPPETFESAARRAQVARDAARDGEAIAAYQVVTDKYPDSPLADDALYFAALAAQQLKNCTEARAYLGVIKSKYTRGNVIKQADELEKALKKDAKNKSKCSS